MKNFYKQILDDVAIELTDEFDQNFQRKAFFNKKWRQTKLINRRGSLMMRTSQLRRSIQMRQGSQSVSWSSSRIDASMHNEGGKITVTAKMKKYFWAMYINVAGIEKNESGKTDWKNTTKIKKGLNGSYKLTKSNKVVASEAEQWKALALMKEGDKITIPQRQFIGDHPEVRKAIERCADQTFQEIDEYMKNLLKQR